MTTTIPPRYLNLPLGLNPVDQNILKEFPPELKNGLVVGSGDGRLMRALKEKIGAEATIFGIEPHKKLRDLTTGLGEIGSDPWDLEHYKHLAKKVGGFDFIIFSNIHEYWTGKLDTMRKILELVKPSGLIWVSFYNATTLYEIGRHLPPLETGFERLGSPMELWARVDLASWMLYLASFTTCVHSVWGMLQDNAYDFCQKTKKESEEWRVKDCHVTVGDVGDAFVLGAPIVSLKFSVGFEQKVGTQFWGVEYNATMIQSVLFPYADILGHELEDFSSYTEVLFYEQEKRHEESALIGFFVNQIQDLGKIKNVLVLGAGWGEDLFVLKSQAKDWQITGIDRSVENVELGKAMAAKQGIKLVVCTEAESLPFADESFDLVISLRHFSNIHYPLAKHLAAEALRVSKIGVALFEDSRGPDFSMRLKAYPLPDLFEELGHKGEILPLNMDAEPTGLYILKVKK